MILMIVDKQVLLKLPQASSALSTLIFSKQTILFGKMELLPTKYNTQLSLRFQNNVAWWTTEMFTGLIRFFFLITWNRKTQDSKQTWHSYRFILL